MKFSFVLPLNSGKSIHVEKIFRLKSINKNEGIIYEYDIPVVEIFPNYFSSRWRKYYLLQGKAEELIFEPISFEENSKIDTNDYREHEEYDPSMRQTIRITEISGDNPFPEGLQLLNKNNNVIIGLILIDKPIKREIGLANKWLIGIDFGTSNTNIFKKAGIDGDIKAERWIFNLPKYLRSITSSDLLNRERILYEFFIPLKEIELPTPTTLRVFHNASLKKLFLDYSIYFPKKFKLPEIVHSELKWKTEGEITTNLFFESLLYFIFLEVISENISEVDIMCSYPKAFSETDKIIFEGYWEGAIKKLINNNELTRLFDTWNEEETPKKDLIHINKIPKFETEGIAAGEYFASPSTIDKIEYRADKTLSALCLDVGGGTTDISIWFSDKIVFDASVLLAGRQISQFIQRNNKIKELLFTEAAVTALNEKKNEPSIFAARLNLILKKEERSIGEMLLRHANKKEIQWLRQMIALEFSALVFYIGTLCIAIEKSNKLGLLERIKTNGIKLHWGGNAAKFISWIDLGRYDPNSRGAKLLNAVFYNCLNDTEALGNNAIKPQSIAQLKSPSHKSEAAGGLVVMNFDGIVKNSDFDMDTNEYNMESISAKEMVTGEQIKLVEGKIEPFDLITNKNLFGDNGSKVKLSTLFRLNRFLDILNFFGLKSGLFNEDTKIQLSDADKRLIQDNVLSEFIKLEKLDEKKRIVEPIFIMEIKILFEILNSRLR